MIVQEPAPLATTLPPSTTATDALSDKNEQVIVGVIATESPTRISSELGETVNVDTGFTIGFSGSLVVCVVDAAVEVVGFLAELDEEEFDVLEDDAVGL